MEYFHMELQILPPAETKRTLSALKEFLRIVAKGSGVVIEQRFINKSCLAVGTYEDCLLPLVLLQLVGIQLMFPLHNRRTEVAWIV